MRPGDLFMKGRKPTSYVRCRTLFTKQIADATVADLVTNYGIVCDVPS